MNWDPVTAVLFDLDGVLTPTASVHMRAWEVMFTRVLEQQPTTLAPYTDQDYFAYIDGKPRYEGVQSFLDAHGIDLPFGEPSDPPERQTVCGLGNRKNELFNKVLEEEGIAPYPGSLRLIEHLEERGIAMAVVSSSKNAPLVLQTAGLTERFPVVVDGTVAVREHLRGKPQPDTYTYAAELLGHDPTGCVVVEDAVSGVQAGAAGTFAWVVGVDRGAGRQALLDAGADEVVADLDELI